MENKSTIQTQRTSTVLSALLAHLVGLRSHNAAFLPPLSKFRISDIGHRISMTAILFLALLTSQNALAQCSQVATATQNMTWTGTASTDWNNPCNWSPNGIPTATNQTIINNVTNDPVVLSGTTAVTKEIYVGTGATLTVNSGGTLNVNITPVPNCITMQGVGSSIINNGTINTGTGDGFGFVTEATSTITNRGTINTNQGLANAIVAGRGNLTFTNESTGVVNGNFRAIDGFGLTLTNRGTVNYSGSTYVLVLRSNGPSSVVNDGTIQCTAGLGIENLGGGTITNNACGKILMSAVNYINRSTTTNAGLISISNNLDNTGGTFTNTGVLKYGSTSGNAVTNNQNSSVIVNNTLPIFTYGSSFNGTVNGIFTNAAATTSAGTFTAPNTFVPSGLPAGSQTLYAKITPSSGACSYIVPFTYQNGCSQVATATQSMTWTGAVSTDWNNPCNWSPNGIPTATNLVNIPATTNDPIISSGTSVAHVVGISGSGASLTVNSGATLTTSTALHDGVLGISNGGLLTNRGTINVAQTYPNGSWRAILMGANGTLDNYGALNLTAPLNTASFVHAGATLNNRSGGHISISNSGRGINLEGTLINQSGATITLSNAEIGVTGGILNNSGNIEATVEIGNASSGQIINNACGSIKLTGSFFNGATSTTTNAGLILISDGLFNPGTFTNNGVLKYNIWRDNAIVNNQNSSVIVNNSLPIFTYGSSFNGTINGIFTNAAATTSAGTFTAPNTFVPSGLPFGSQTLYAKITPSGGACSYVVPFTYNNAPPTLSAGNVTNPTTCGGTGSIAFTTTDVANGTYWLSFTTTGTSSPQNVTVTNNAFTLGNLQRGDYSNFSLNVNGTNATTNVTKTVNAPAAPTISGLSQTNILCNGGTTGGFTFSVSGGAVVVRDAANNIIPTTGANPYTVTGRAAGAYLISVNNGCTTSQSVTLTQPSTALSMSTAQTNVTTNGGNNGTITVTASGGTSAFQFSKDGGSTYTSGTSPFTFNFLTAATYQIRVKDANGCETANSAVTITQPTAVSFTTTPTNILCNGASTGSIQVTVSAGTAPYQFSKDDGATFTAGTSPFTFNGLAAGTYKIKVKDNTGFVTTAQSVTLTQPTPLSISTTDVDVTINGGNNGKITVTASGGTGALQFSKNGGTTYTAGASPFEFTALTAATYQIRVKDANGCETANNAVIISQPVAVSFTTTKTNILCNGASTGTIQVTVSAGTSPYQFSKDDGATFTAGTTPFTFSGLAAGTYKIKVKDNTGFITAASSVTLTQPSTPLSLSTVQTNVSINGGNNGKITVTASGGTGALQFSKNGGTTYTAGTSPFDFTALTAATYQIRVKDANGCETANSAVAITQPVAVSFTTTKTNILCNGASTGTIQVTVSAGTSPYQFSKDDGATFTTGTTPFTFNGLAAGTYKIKVKDNTGFITTASSVVLTQPTPLSISTTDVDVTMNGGNNGKITVTASGGTGALQFSKNGGTTYTAGTSPFEFTALTAATYQIRVKDANGCETANSAVIISQPVAVSFTTTKTNILCNGASTGAIQVTVSAGTSPYEFSKDDGATFTAGTSPFTFSGLAAGTYKIKVKDQTGFITAASSVTLTQPTPLSISTAQTNVSINGGNNGKITVTASGGTGALQFSKNGGTTYTAGTSPFDFNTLTAATYQIRVKDANGCQTANSTVAITQPTAVSFTTTKTNITCNGASTGAIQVNASAGVAPYQFSKDDGATFTTGTTPFTFNGLAAGTYKIRVKDQTGFITTAQSVTLTQPTALNVSTSETDVTINGGNDGKITVTASGGTGALQFSKNGGTTYTAGTSPFEFNTLTAGTYDIRVKDANGCETPVNEATITQPTAVNFSSTRTFLTCYGSSTGKIQINVTAGTSPFEFSKDDGATFIAGTSPFTFNSLAAGTYKIKVKDNTGFTTTASSVVLPQPAPLSISTSDVDVSINGGNNGKITVTASGGTGALQFSKDGGTTYTAGTSPFEFNTLTAATYQIRIKDTKGCESANNAVTITQPVAVSFITDKTNIACKDASTGAIEVDVTAGTSPFEYSKDDGATFTAGTNPFTFNDLAAGTYKIKVKDQTGFITSASSVILTQPTALSLSTAPTNVSINGGNDGKIIVTASGGTGALQFSKDGGTIYTAGTSPFEFTALTAATYQIRVKDANGCETANSEVTISQPTAVNFSTSKTNIACNGASTGTIQVNVTNGTSPFEFSKDNGSTFTAGTSPFTFNGLAAGTYRIKVKDNTGFITAASSVTLTQPTPLSMSTSDLDVSINGGNNGKITVTASGGTGALQFSKDGGANYSAGTSPFEFTNLTANTYQIRVKDANGCETTASAVTISEPTTVNFTTDKTDITCNGTSTGEIDINVTNGTSPFQFSKDDGATFTAGTNPFTFNSLAAGTYKIKVKDQTGFITSASSITLNQPTALSLSTDPTNITINGGNDGKITVTASGGTGALQFSKDGGTNYAAGTSPFEFNILSAATYQIRVKDANGCETANSEVTINQPTAVNFTTSKTNVACNGASTGSIQVNVTNGTTPFEFSKDDGATFTAGTNPFTFNGLAAGTYKIKVKDNTGFITAASSVALTQPAPLSMSTTDVDVSINGGNNGKITVTASGGTGALQFSKDGGTTYMAGTSPFEFNTLTAATYQIRVKDANGCETANNAVTITQPTTVNFTTDKSDITCNGTSTGEIEVYVTNGTSPFEYSKDDGVTFATGTNPFTFNGLAAATYKIKVKDNTGFVTSATSVTLTQPTPLSMSTSKMDVTVNGGDNGKITVTAGGGAGALQFSKDGGTNYTAGTSPFDFNTLTAGDYQIRVKDANGCETAISTVTITQPTAVTFTTSETHIVCNGASTGAIQVTVTAGTSPFEFSKDDGATFTAGTNPFTFNGLAAGDYKIKVKDNTGFVSSATTVTLTQPRLATATEDMTWTGTVSTDWNNACNWSPNGIPTATNSVSIPNVANDPVIMNGITANAFRIDIGNNASLTINSGGELNVLPTDVLFGISAIYFSSNTTLTNNGTLNANSTVNVPLITLANNNSIFNNNGTANLNSPLRNIVMNGTNAMVNNSVSGIINFQSARGINCINGTTGNVITNQGTMNYTGYDYFAALNPGFTLNNSGTIDIKSGSGIAMQGGTVNNLACAKILMPERIYDNRNSSVTTNAGLMITGSINNNGGSFTNNGILKYSSMSGNAIINNQNSSVIVNNTLPIFTYGGTYDGTINGIFKDATATTSAGTFTAPNTFTPSGLMCGANTLYAQITPMGGACSYIVPFTYTAVPPTVSITGLNSAYCKDAMAVTLTGNPAGGTFKIDGNAATQFDPSVLSAGSRVVVYTYTDGNGCTNTKSQTVTVNALPVLSITGLNAAYCKSATAVTLTGTPTGGTFKIDGNAATQFDPSVLSVGNHTVMYSYTDGNGCSNSTSQTVAVNALPVVSITGSNTAYCKSASAVTLTGNPSGGSFKIDGNGATQFDPSVLTVGNHSVVYTYSDGNGCANSTSQTVAVNALPVVSITGLNAAYCKSATAVTLTGTPIGGTFKIDGNAATQFDPSVLSVGNHTVIYSFTDGNSCSNTTSQTVAVNALPVVSITGLNAAYCESANAVTLTGNPSGGTFKIDGNAATQFNPSVLSIGNHTVVYSYSDGNGCANSASQTVTVGALPIFNPAIVQNVNCSGGNDGRVTLSISGGTGIISYTINPSSGQQNPSGTFNGLAANTYTFTATDANNCQITTTATVGTIVNTPPNITLTSPTNGSIFTTNHIITVNATDPNGSIAQVNFYSVINGDGDKVPFKRILLGSSTVAPFSFNWNNIPGGHYNIQAEAVDNCGLKTFSSVAEIKVLSTFNVLIGSPAPKEEFISGSNLTISASVVGFTQRTVAKVEFFNGNTKLGEDLTAPYSYLWMNVPSGSHALRAVATDNLGGVWYSNYTYIFGINPSNRNVQRQTATPAVFTLFPNPTNSQVYFHTTITEDGNYNINILDMMGRIVVTKQNNYAVGALAETLDVSSLAKGIYMVRFVKENGKDAAIQKLIIE